MSEPTRDLPELSEPTRGLEPTRDVPEPTRILPELSEPTRGLPEFSEPTVAMAGATDSTTESAPALPGLSGPAGVDTGAPAGVGGSPDPEPASSPWQRPDADGGILTLPPIDDLPTALPLSAATGQPRRAPGMLVGMGLLYAAATASAVALGKAWWDTIHVEGWPHSVHLLQWANVRAGSWQSIVLSVLVCLIGLLMVTVPAIAGFNAWNGHRWSRWAGVTAAAVSLLAVLLNPIAWLALPLAALGTLVLFLPPVTRYFDLWERFRGGEPQQPVEFTNVFYGPLPRYR